LNQKTFTLYFLHSTTRSAEPQYFGCVVTYLLKYTAGLPTKLLGNEQSYANYQQHKSSPRILVSGDTLQG